MRSVRFARLPVSGAAERCQRGGDSTVLQSLDCIDSAHDLSADSLHCEMPRACIMLFPTDADIGS